VRLNQGRIDRQRALIAILRLFQPLAFQENIA